MPSDLYFLCILIIGVPRKVCYGSEIPPLQVIFAVCPPFPIVDRCFVKCRLLLYIVYFAVDAFLYDIERIAASHVSMYHEPHGEIAVACLVGWLLIRFLP